jgi:hypothetical protein
MKTGVNYCESCGAITNKYDSDTRPQHKILNCGKCKKLFMTQPPKPTTEKGSEINITSNFISQWLRYCGVVKPGKWFYEWTGATVVEKTTDNSEWYFEDSINAYTEAELDEMLPNNVAVNENIKEIGYRPGDSMAEKKGKLLVWLLENNLISNAKWYMPTIHASNKKHAKEPELT